VFALMFHVYKCLDPREELLATKTVAWYDFLLLTCTRFVEPDPFALPWFKAFSAGK
jgi:hypothetical protein